MKTLIAISVLVSIFVLPLSAVSDSDNEDLYTACRNIPLQSDSSAVSKVLLVIPFGTTVKVLKFYDYYELPKSAQKNDQAPEDDPASMGSGGEDIGGHGATTEEEKKEPTKVPAWAKVQAGDKTGFISFRCLVDKDVLEKQDPTKALRKAQKQDVLRAGKGFSEQEDGDLVAMKGAVGKAKAGDANYKAIDEILSQPTEYNRKDVYKNFRKEGNLGEFKK